VTLGASAGSMVSMKRILCHITGLAAMAMVGLAMGRFDSPGGFGLESSAIAFIGFAGTVWYLRWVRSK
jgi:hypothetical protein